MQRHLLSLGLTRRAFVTAASALGAGFATRAFADAPEAPDMPEPAPVPEAAPAAVEEEAAPAGAGEGVTLQREWLLEDIMGGGVIDRIQMTLDVKEDGSVSGHGGCNRFAGKAEIDGDRLKFGPLASTRMACLDVEMDQEQKYFEALGKVASFRIDEQQRKLFLQDESGATVLTYSAMT